MAVGTVEFYAMPGALSTGEYPILSPDQNVSGYLVASVPKCKYTKDLLQAVGPMAIFDDYDTVNMAKIEDDWYWVVDWTTQSLQSESVIFGLSYNAPTSLFRLGDSVTGVWKRTPTMTRPYMSATISNDAMASSRYIGFPTLPEYKARSDYDLCKLFWVEVVSSGFGSDHSKLVRLGFFASMDVNNLYPSGTDVYNFYNNDTHYNYPNMKDVISNPEDTLGILSDEIIQISFSDKCPYEYTLSDYTYGGYTYQMISLNIGMVPYRLSNGYYVYLDIEPTALLQPSWPSGFKSPDTVTMTLTDMERMCGSVRILNESGMTIATVPTQYGDSIELKIRTFDDYTGIYTEITYDDRLIATLNEGHLPWIGDTFKQYQARQLEMDRQMMSLANDQARQDLNLSLRQSELNQVMTQINSLSSLSLFSPGSYVGAGLGIIEADIKGGLERRAMESRTNMEIRANETRQELTEKMMKAEPGTTYSMGYGTIYGKNSILHPARVQLELPVNLTAEYFGSYMSEFGYPSEGKQTLTLSAGYIQGQIINDGSVTGAKFDELSRTIQNGFKMKVLT